MKKQFVEIIRLLPVAIFLLVAATFAYSQTEEPATREITSLDFQTQRPKAGSIKAEVKVTTPKKTTPRQKKNIAVISNRNRRYNLVKRIPIKAKITVQTNTGGKNNQNNPNNPTNPNQKTVRKTEQIGVTFWRLRPLAPDDGDVPVFPVRVGDGRENWTAERVNSTTRFKIGDRVRFTIESSRSGYLYIINREYYTDGTAGEANIIFPTLRTRGGDNRVVAGSLIDVPSSTDSVSYFTIKPRRKDYAGEELTVLITKDQLPLELGLKPLAVGRPDLDKWFEDWETTVDIYDAEDGEGIAVTDTEMNAVQNTSRALEQEEPLPQTIYKVQIGSEMPLLVSFRMTTVSP